MDNKRYEELCVVDDLRGLNITEAGELLVAYGELLRELEIANAQMTAIRERENGHLAEIKRLRELLDEAEVDDCCDSEFAGYSGSWEWWKE